MTIFINNKRKHFIHTFLKPPTTKPKFNWLVLNPTPYRHLKKMLSFWVHHINNTDFFYLILIILVVFSFLQLLLQTNIIFFLAYKTLFLFYIGCLLIQLNLDITAFILWITYGTYIIVIAALSLMLFQFFNHLNFNRTRTFWNNWWFLCNLSFIIITITIWLSPLKTFIYSYVNYYELLTLDHYNELEQLGWNLGYVNLSWTIAITILLSFTCIFIVFLTTLTKNFKILQNLHLFCHSKLQPVPHILKTQTFFLQESNKKFRKMITHKNIIKRRF